jgi:hypothetical protein
MFELLFVGPFTIDLKNMNYVSPTRYGFIILQQLTMKTQDLIANA